MAYEVTIGERYDQDQIKAIFNTGFGYQITGINVRRDDADQRYILLLANEDEPYDDNVRQGQFEYIGEGLSGDQSASSPGNSSLIDAVETPVPIYFFYKDATDEGWEYQGLVAVRDYRIEEHDGRDVFVFKMKHTEGQSNAVYSLPTGVTSYIGTLERLLLYIESNEPTYDELLQWFFTTFDLSGEAYVKRGISLVKKLGFIDRSGGHYQVAESGHAYLDTRDSAAR